MTDEEIKNLIQAEIRKAISEHTHIGIGSKKLSGKALMGTPVSALTPASGGSLSSGGAAVLSNSDSTILSNAITRLNALEDALQTLNFLE